MNKTTDTLFRVGLVIKLVDSVFEMIGGAILTVPTKLAGWLLLLSQHELDKHHNAMVGRLDHITDLVLTKAFMGEAIYLLIHGLAKLILISAIFVGKDWGYRGLIVVLSLFSLLEVAQGIRAHEYVPIILALFDGFLVWLIWKELRAKDAGPAAAAAN